MELNVHVNLLKPNNIESRNGCNGSGKLGLGGDLGGGANLYFWIFCRHIQYTGTTYIYTLKM